MLQYYVGLITGFLAGMTTICLLLRWLEIWRMQRLLKALKKK